MKLNSSQIKIDWNGMRDESRAYFQDDDNYYSQLRQVRLVHTEQDGWQLTDGRHRLEATQERGGWWIEAEYEKWDEQGRVIESGHLMVTL